MPDIRCELIMLGRDTCGLPGEQCPYCSRPHYFCRQCFPEHNKIHQPRTEEIRSTDFSLYMDRLKGSDPAYITNVMSDYIDRLRVENKALKEELARLEQKR